MLQIRRSLLEFSSAPVSLQHESKRRAVWLCSIRRHCFAPQWRSFEGKRKGGVRQAFHRNAVVAKDISLSASDGFLVGDADDAERLADAVLQEHAGTGFAKSAVDEMFFNGHDSATLPSCIENGFGIERLDRVHAEHAKGHAL